MKYRCFAIIFYNIYFLQSSLSYLLSSDQIRQHSSVVEYSTVDREDLGSNPSAPFEIISRNSKITEIFSLYLSQDYNGETVNL